MTDGPLTFRELDSIPVVRLRGVGERKREALAAVGVETVLDLLTTYPRRWVDRTNEARVSDLVPGTEALVLVSVRSTSKRMGRNRRTIVETVVGDGTGRMHVVFFNQPWRERQLTPGLEVALYGKVDTYRGGLQMANPVVDLIGDRTGRIVPIYPQSEKVQLTTWELAGWVENALQRAEVRGFADPVPAPVRRRLGLLDRGSALHDIHVPESIADKERARRRLAFDELLRVQVALVMRKRAMERESVGIRHQPGGELVERFHGGLPFPLTAAQRPGHRRDRGRPRPSAPDAPSAAGRRRIRQDGRRRDGFARRRAGRAPGCVDGADRGARRAARRIRAPDARRAARARRQPVRRAAALRRAAHQPGRPAPSAGGSLPAWRTDRSTS